MLTTICCKGLKNFWSQTPLKGSQAPIIVIRIKKVPGSLTSVGHKNFLSLMIDYALA